MNTFLHQMCQPSIYEHMRYNFPLLTNYSGTRICPAMYVWKKDPQVLCSHGSSEIHLVWYHQFLDPEVQSILALTCGSSRGLKASLWYLPDSMSPCGKLFPPLMTYDPLRQKLALQLSSLCEVKFRKSFFQEGFHGDYRDGLHYIRA